jgi:hypothetical protein
MQNVPKMFSIDSTVLLFVVFTTVVMNIYKCGH